MNPNTATFSTEYLEKIIAIPTPKNLDIVIDSETIYNYSQLRNAARDLLYNPNDAEVQRKLSHLIVKLKGKV